MVTIKAFDDFTVDETNVALIQLGEVLITLLVDLTEWLRGAVASNSNRGLDRLVAGFDVLIAAEEPAQIQLSGGFDLEPC